MPISSHLTQSISTSIFTFSGDDLLAALRKTGKLPDELKGEGVEITFLVPGGGDWSNARVEVDHEHPITVRLTRRFESTIPPSS